jgi:hypothetical protein
LIEFSILTRSVDPARIEQWQSRPETSSIQRRQSEQCRESSSTQTSHLYTWAFLPFLSSYGNPWFDLIK